MQLSTVDSITRYAGFDSGGFSAVKTMGECVNNREFSMGFRDFLLGRKSASAYVWTCLSACADDIGETVYNNVQNYIDFVSNVETCKIPALRSMMKMYGFDYTVFDDIELVPQEVLNLMHVMSIDRKYLLNSSYLKDNLRQDLKDFGAITVATIGELSDYYTLSALSKDQLSSIVSSYEVVDDGKYFEYTCGLFESLLSGFCTLKYLQAPDDDRNPYYIYKTLDMGQFGTTVDESDTDFSEWKRQHNIPVSFNQSRVVDNIDDGTDSLDNYQYPYYDLVMKEIDYRASKVSKAELDASGSAQGKEYDTDRSIKNETRYSYYRKAKVREYVGFIDNKYFIDNAARLSSQLYDIDQRFVYVDDLGKSVLDRVDGKIVGLDGDVIRTVARSLAVATRYVNKLREKLKLQTRKNYMKGTQNLLLYVINEYLIDYSRHQAETLDFSQFSDDDKAQVMAVLSTLQQHSIDQLGVVEYYDDTEYYNLSTDTTGKAVSSEAVFQKFWHDGAMAADGKSYALAEIQQFYLSSLAMQRDLSSEDELSSFLDAVFDIGADKSYVDAATGLFTVKLSSYGRYSDGVYLEHQELSGAYDAFLSYKPAGYEYPAGPISSQISSVIDAISADLYTKYHDGVSAAYQTHMPEVEQFEERFASMEDEFDDIVSGDSMLYFVSSDCKYCFSEDTSTGARRYRHNYYVGNPVYQQDENYFTVRLDTLRAYMDGKDDEGSSNITNFPIMDTVQAVYAKCAVISSEYQRDVVPALTGYGFTDLCADTIDAELQQGYDFIKTRQDRRLAFLSEQLSQIRVEANNLRTLYQNVQTNFASVVAGYDDGSLLVDLNEDTIYNVCRQSISRGTIEKATAQFDIEGYAKESATPPGQGTMREWQQYNTIVSKYAYQQVNKEGEQVDGTYPYNSTDGVGYDASAPIETRISQFIGHLDAPTAFDIEKETDESGTTYSIVKEYYGLKKEGSYAGAVQCQENVGTIENTINSVVNQVNSIGGDLDVSSQRTLEDKINRINEYLNTEFSEANFENDKTIQEYKALLQKIARLSADYVPYKSDYFSLYSAEEQATYLDGFQHGASLTFAALAKLSVYTLNKDRAALDSLTVRHELLRENLTTLERDYEALASEMQLLQYEYYRPGAVYEPYYDKYSGIIEVGLADARAFLESDLAKKADDADWMVGNEMEKLDRHMAVMQREISAELGGTTKFEDEVSARLRYLDIFQDEQYLDRRGMFLTYAGREMCYYPYFNLTNVTHPSYQIHPFLWNFISKDSADVSEITKVFYTVNPAEFDEFSFVKNVDKYYGEFGQSVNQWMSRDIIDYSGYVTRYESSDHVSDSSQISSEVVDFDGAFYPPAVAELFRCEELNGSISKCADSVLCGKYFSSQNSRDDLVAALPGDLSSYVVLRENYDRDKAQVSSWTYVRDLSVYGALSGLVEPYVVSSDLRSGIDRYFARNLTDAQLTAVSKSGLVNSLAGALEPTFYDRFYRHLNYGKNAEELEYLAQQLCCNFDCMSETVLSPMTKAEQYDIYRYGLDQQGNAYILFKQYHDAEATYRDRQNARGSLWIRLKDHPLAFPAFTGERPNVLLSSYWDIPEPFRRLAGLEDECSAVYPHYISSAMSCFYDFEITKNGQYVYLMSEQRGKYGGERISDDERIKTYENSWIINCPVQFASGQVVLMDFRHSQVSGDLTTSIIRSGRDVGANSRLSAVPEPGVVVQNYAYIGSLLKNSTTTDFVYVKKNYCQDPADGSISSSIDGEIKVLQTVNGLYRTNSDIVGDDIIDSAIGSDVCFSYDRDGVFTFAYVKDQDLSCVASQLSSRTDLSRNTEGRIFSDPRSGEMNSHDILMSDVAVVKCVAQTNRLTRASKKATVDATFNMNADMSYLPCYPGMSGEISVYQTGLSSDVYLPMQLLGDSKNIDSNIKAVNPDVDPYFDMSRISDDYLFGRVYEDWYNYVSADNTFRMFSNGTINSRSNPEHSPEYFVWSIPLSGYAYNPNAKRTLRVLAYNSRTLGKNPYFVGMVSQLSSESGDWADVVNYNDEYTVENGRETVVGTTLSGSDSGVNVTGTFSGKKNLNRSDCNHIANIGGMMMRYLPGTEELQLKFEVEDEEKIDWTYVGKGVVQVLLYNPNDLTMFEYFHYLDAYGAVNVYNGKVDIPNDVPFQNGGATLVYDRKKYEDINMSALACSYYNDERGVRKFLTGPTAIQLSDYTCLSDVYVLQGSRRLQMEYASNDYFDFGDDHYFFPTLNTKYPKTAGDFVASPSCMFESQAVQNQLSSVFGENNLYIMDLADPSGMVQKFGRVEIPVTYDDVDCFRCFEKFTEFEDGETPVSGLYGKFDVYDSRTMQYVRFDELYTSESTHTEEEIRAAVGTAFEQHAETSAFVDAVSVYTRPRFQEQVLNSSLESVRFDVVSADLADLMKLYVNYKKSDDGIVLYFNYFNYLSTPYVRFEGNRLYPDYVDGTYLKLAPGESGVVNIVAQLKYYVGQTVYGYKNARLVSYNVYNVSDDKPKFIISKVETIKPGDLLKTEESPNVRISIAEQIIDPSKYPAAEKPRSQIECVIEPDQKLAAPFTVEIDYPYDLVKADVDDVSYGIRVEDSGGYLTVTVLSPAVDYFRIGVESRIEARELPEYSNTYAVDVSRSYITGANGYAAVVDVENGSFVVK